MIKLTLYDKQNNYRILEINYYRNSELDEALEVVKDYEGDEQITVGMNNHSKDYIGYIRKRNTERKFRAALRDAASPEERKHLKQLVKEYKKDKKITAEKRTAAPSQEKPFSAPAFGMSFEEWKNEMPKTGETYIQRYQFSERFEREMDEMLLRYGKKRRQHKILRYAAEAAFVVVALTVTLSWASFRSALASEPGLTISAWVQDHFSFNQSSENNQELSFDAERFGYVPDGFVLKEAEVSSTTVKYEYKNNLNEYFTLKVSNMDASKQQHNENIDMENGLTTSGLEYMYFYEKDYKIHVFMWEGTDSLFYDLRGTINKEFMTDIMNGIQYER